MQMMGGDHNLCFQLGGRGHDCFLGFGWGVIVYIFVYVVNNVVMNLLIRFVIQ